MYYLNEQLTAASAVVQMAVNSNNSIAIFLEGVPGSGKTAFAKHLRDANGYDFYRYDCNVESNSGLLYSFDLEGIVTQKAAYLKGPLWEAFEASGPTVMLIDEVDKSPRDFEAFLLRVTDEQSFRAPNNQEVTAAVPVIFVFSSNGRREMSPEFLRRCMRIRVEYPTGKLLRTIVTQETPWGSPESRMIDLLCRIAEAMKAHVEPDQMPSPKEIAFAAASLPAAQNKTQIEAIFSSFMLKGLTIHECTGHVKFDVVKAIKNTL